MASTAAPILPQPFPMKVLADNYEVDQALKKLDAATSALYTKEEDWLRLNGLFSQLIKSQYVEPLNIQKRVWRAQLQAGQYVAQKKTFKVTEELLENTEKELDEICDIIFQATDEPETLQARQDLLARITRAYQFLIFPLDSFDKHQSPIPPKIEACKINLEGLKRKNKKVINLFFIAIAALCAAFFAAGYLARGVTKR